MLSKKRFIAICLFILASLLIIIGICNGLIEKEAEGKIFAEVQSVPYNKVGLLLGTSKYLSTGQINYYYAYRIKAAIELLKANKIKYIIVSGDNMHKSYNEPKQMQSDLVAAGIDSTRIFLDYAGFRTFDSMVRLKKVFGHNAATVISQPFHNERALYIASQEGINAIGFNARDVNKNAGLRVRLREKLARVKVFVDYLFHKEPKFLGEKVIIPA